MKRKSLRSEIIRLYEEEHLTVTQIAARLGCSKANVSTMIKRALSWDQTISPPLPESIVQWLMGEAVRLDKSPAAVAREIIITAYNHAKENGNG